MCAYMTYPLNADCSHPLQAKKNFFWRYRVRNRTDKNHSPAYFSRMPTGTPPPLDVDLDTQAQLALEEARAMSPGPEKTEALRKAGLLRNAADVNGFLFAKRGRPRKS
jgi:hypothetical protein